MNTYVNEESIIYLPEDKIDKETYYLSYII